MHINWYPGHMHKAVKELRSLMPSMHVYIEVIDARLPASSENPLIREIAGDKPRLLILNKADLADQQVTEQWLEHYRSVENQSALAVQQRQRDVADQVFNACRTLAGGHGHLETLRVLICGIPNVGKSTLINLLAKREVAKTGNEPAITKAQQKIQCAGGVLLFDSPGILWPKLDDQQGAYRLACSGAIRNTAVKEDDIVLFAIDYLMTSYPQALVEYTGSDIAGMDDITFLQYFATVRGCLGRGGSLDYKRAAMLLLMDLRAGRIANISFEAPPNSAV